MLETWLLAAMLAWQPPRTEAVKDRYAEIATDIAIVARDPDEIPLFDDDPNRAKMAILLLAIAYWESFFRKDVDDGRVRGDGGRAWCIMQVHVYGRTSQGWSGPELIADRQKCIRVGLSRARASLQACRKLRLEDRLSGYLRGRCMAQDRMSALRVRWAKAWLKEHEAELQT